MDPTYLLDNEAAEAGHRFDSLATLFDGVTTRHLRHLGVPVGGRGLEVGAGGMTVVRWLARRVGPQGTVVATDIDPRWLEASPPNVRIWRHDIALDPLPVDTFDVVHARIVLTHVPDRAEALAKMVRAVRPGGWLLVEDLDPDLAPEACCGAETDDQRLANRVRAGFLDLLRGRGVDLRFGRALPGLLEHHGLVAVGADGHLAPRCCAADALEHANVSQLADALVATGVVSPEQLAHLLDRLRAGRIGIDLPPLISAWGRRAG